MQNFQILAKVASAVLGGEKKAKPPENFDEALSQFNGVFGK